MSTKYQGLPAAKVPGAFSLLYLLLVPGCGSKDIGAKAEAPQAGDPAPIITASPSIPAPKPAVIPAVISWEVENAKVPGRHSAARNRSFITREGGNLIEMDREILLPARVPKRIRITLMLPEVLSAATGIPGGEARLISKDSTPQPLNFEYHHCSDTNWRC